MLEIVPSAAADSLLYDGAIPALTVCPQRSRKIPTYLHFPASRLVPVTCLQIMPAFLDQFRSAGVAPWWLELAYKYRSRRIFE